MTRSGLKLLALVLAAWTVGLITDVRASLSNAEREAQAEVAKRKPSIELEIDFEQRSAGIRVRSNAFDQLTALGLALLNRELKGRIFLIAGHTGLEGNEVYNQELSIRRADTVKRFLVENFNIEPEDLVAVGYGSRKLKNPADPFAPENQRVEIVNVGDWPPK